MYNIIAVDFRRLDDSATQLTRSSIKQWSLNTIYALKLTGESLLFLVFLVNFRSSQMSAAATKRSTKNSSFFCRVVSGLVVFVVVAGFVYKSFPTLSFRSIDNLETIGSSIPSLGGLSQSGSISTSSTNNAAIQTVEEVYSDTPNGEIISQIKELRRRGKEFLDFVTKGGDSASNPPFIRWDLISKADVHIIHILVKYIDFNLRSPQRQLRLERIFKYGYQCSISDMVRQEIISKFISMDICSEVEWYKFLHFAWPEASTFMDVGANKGYLGSLFLTLWGGSGLQSSPAQLYEVATKMEAWKTSRNPKGYCKDGDHYGVSMFCPSGIKRDEKTGHCGAFNPNTRVFSLDGSSYLAQTLTSIIHHFPPYRHTDGIVYRASDMWRYQNFAVSDVHGTARFTKQTKEKNPGFEGGGIRSSSPAKQSSQSSEEEEVPMVFVDYFIEKSNITKVDLLKIDTEGNDNKVLRGAKLALAKSIGMFAFEGGKGVSFSKDMIMSLDKIGYSCYSTSRAGLFKWNGGCMPERFMGGFAAKDKGNIFCINRRRAPLAAFAYDALIFPAMIDLLADPEFVSLLSEDEKKQLRGLHIAANTTLGAKSAAEVQANIEPSMFFPSYVNIRGFCKPWPSCAGVQ